MGFILKLCSVMSINYLAWDWLVIMIVSVQISVLVSYSSTGFISIKYFLIINQIVNAKLNAKEKEERF